MSDKQTILNQFASARAELLAHRKKLIEELNSIDEALGVEQPVRGRTQAVIEYLYEHGPSTSNAIRKGIAPNLSHSITATLLQLFKNNRIVRIGEQPPTGTLGRPALPFLYDLTPAVREECQQRKENRPH